MFNRSLLGMANEFLFHDVDLIVYCEGRKHSDEDEDSTFDEAFWGKIFELKGKRIKCKSIGEKPHLLEVAAVVSSEGIPNVVVAMDRDYDHLRGLTIDHPHVFYTFGYSWESDVVLDFDFDSAMALFANVKDRKAVRLEFESYRAKQSVVLKRLFALDVKYIGHDKKLFDRTKPLSIVNLVKAKEPRFRVRELLDDARTLGKYQTTTLSRDIYSKVCGVKDFFGKTVAHLFYQWFVYRTSAMSSARKIPYAAFIGNLISTFSLNSSTSERNKYYDKLLSNL